VGLFGVGKKPTGAADPYGLRRACLSLVRIVLERGYRFSLSKALDAALAGFDHGGVKLNDPKKTRIEVLEYVRERLKNEWSETRRVDVVEAVLSAGFDDLVATQLRLDALSGIVGQPGFEPLAIAFKRVVNIVQKQGEKVPAGEVDAERFAEVAERELFKALLSTRSAVDELAKKDDYAGALARITGLKGPVDTFFDKVMVMAEDPDLRNNRVRMLREIGSVFANVADFSQIQAGEKG
jgi:glycyl-tRNA synthetase beta chain